MAFEFQPLDLSLTGGGTDNRGVTADALSRFGDSPPPQSPGFGFFDESDADGVLTQQGLLAPGLGLAGGAFNIYAGLKALGQQQESLDFQKGAFNKNFAANKAAFQENLRSKFSRKSALGGHKGVTEAEFVDKRSNF
jgi:hypothetical protein